MTLTIHSEDNPAESIDVSVSGLVEQLTHSELHELADEIEYEHDIEICMEQEDFDQDDYVKLPERDNIYNAEWADAICKLSEGRHRLSVDDEMAIKRIADKL